MKRRKKIEFQIDFPTLYGIGEDKRRAHYVEDDPEETFRLILNAIPQKYRNWYSIEFELDVGRYEVSGTSFRETFDFWQSVEFFANTK